MPTVKEITQELDNIADPQAIRDLSIEEPSIDVAHLISEVKEDFSQCFRTLEEFLGEMPDLEMRFEKAKGYNTENATNELVLGEKPPSRLLFELAVTRGKRYPFMKPKSQAKVTISNDFSHRNYEFSYKLPAPGKTLTNDEVRAAVMELERVSLAEGYSPKDEARLVRAVTNLTGVSQFAKSYSSKKYSLLCLNLNEKVRAYLSEVTDSLGKFSTSLKERLESIADSLSAEGFQRTIDEKKEQAEAMVGAEADNLIGKLKSYEDNFYGALDEQRRNFESECQEREQRLSGLESELKEKLAQLDERLAGHRKKIDEESFKIGPGLAKIFPDNVGEGWRNHEKYYHRVDGYLRTFYGLRLQEDLSQVEGVAVGHSLEVLHILKQECIHARNRCKGHELKTVYMGLRAVLDYVSRYEISIVEVTEKIRSTAAKRQSHKVKPSPEELLEAALLYDFDMNKYEKGLHDINTRDKTGLGLK